MTDNYQVNRFRNACTLARTAQLAGTSRVVALAHGAMQGIGGGKRAYLFDLAVVLQLGRAVHRVADHRVFEPSLVPDGAAGHGAGCHPDANPRCRQLSV